MNFRENLLAGGPNSPPRTYLQVFNRPCSSGCIKALRRKETIYSWERDRPLEIHVRDDCKLVEIWLSNLEKEDAEVRERLKPLCQAYHARKYLVAVFRSGTEPLFEGTRDLLLYNRRRLAEQEVQQAKSSGPAMEP